MLRNTILLLVATLFLLPSVAAQAQAKKGPTAKKPGITRKAPAAKRRPRPRRRPRSKKPPAPEVKKEAPAKEAVEPKKEKAKPAPRRAPPAPEVKIKKVQVNKPAGLLDFLGRLHLVMVHLPIGWLLLLLLVDIGTFGFKLREFNRAGALILFGSFLSLVPAVATGFIRVTYISTAANVELLQLHRNLSLGLVAVILLAFLERTRSRNRLEGGPKIFYLALVMVAIALMAMGGYLGAQISFGPHILF
jgi:uncharacterized membrane protein